MISSGQCREGIEAGQRGRVWINKEVGLLASENLATRHFGFQAVAIIASGKVQFWVVQREGVGLPGCALQFPGKRQKFEQEKAGCVISWFVANRLDLAGDGICKVTLAE